MENQDSARREFLKLSAMGMGGLATPGWLIGQKNERAAFAVPSGPGKKLNIVCVGAHPGDPEFGCGGTLARFSEAGHALTLIYLTRGEAGDPSKSYAESAALRTREAEKACEILRAKALFAGQIDAHAELNQTRNEEMTRLILGQNPDIVFTQWPLDTHIDHQITGLLTLTAWVKSEQSFDFYFYEVNTGTETLAFEPTDYVDITATREKKKAALFAHQTQRPQETYDSFFKTMEEFRGLQAGVRAAEAFVHFKSRAGRAGITGL